MSGLCELKAEAKRLGVTWAEVVQVKRECEQVMLDSRELEEGVRRRAWELFLHYAGRSRGCRGFWRVGWDHVRARLENGGRDYTSLPGYDLLIRDVTEEYPEWSGRETAELFDFLFTDYQPRPSALELFSEALGLIEAAVASVPF